MLVPFFSSVRIKKRFRETGNSRLVFCQDSGLFGRKYIKPAEFSQAGHQESSLQGFPYMHSGWVGGPGGPPALKKIFFVLLEIV